MAKFLRKANSMQTTTSSHPHKILSLSLVFLLTGLLGCSHGSQGEQQAGAKPGSTAPAAAPAGGQQAAPEPPAAHATPPAAGGTAAGAAPGQAAPPEPPLAPEKIPPVVAKVNGAAIKKEELIKTADQVHKQMMPNQPQTADFYRRVLDNLVNRELLIQEAKTAGITATDAEIGKQLAELKGRFPSPEKFQEELKAEGMTEAELTQRARDAFVVQKLVETKVVAEIKVTDAEEKAFYDKNQAQMKRPERVHVRHILVKVDKSASPVEKTKAKEKAESLLAKIKAGGDFAKLATENSDDPGSKQRGGDLSWVPRGQTVPQFEAAAFALKQPNDLSPVVETDYGYHVIQLLEHQDAGAVPFAEVKDKIGEFLKQQQQQEKVQNHLKELRAKGKVEVFI
jgi:peptidyl-prolyl cis-trans isomerase C